MIANGGHNRRVRTAIVQQGATLRFFVQFIAKT